MTRILFALTFFFVLAFSSIVAKAQDTRSWSSDIFIKIQETTEPGATAEVVFHNDLIHIKNESFILELDGLIVDVFFEFNVGGPLGADERITVLPPQGYLARPETIDVPEGQTGIIYIYRSDLY